MTIILALIDHLVSDWDVLLLKEMFFDRDVELIMKIPISPSFDDQWCWRDDIRSAYTVKQGYKLIMEGVVSETTQFTTWKLGLPPKIRNFVWRCARAILPTCTILARHGVNVDMFFPLCHLHPETPLHLFRQFHHTCGLWDNFIGLSTVVDNEGFEVWLSKIIEGKDEAIICGCMALCWSVSNCRNDVI